MDVDKGECYCLCKKPYEENQFMIECDSCKDWFHGSCVGITEYEASVIDVYHCPNCRKSDGQLRLKLQLSCTSVPCASTATRMSEKTGGKLTAGSPEFVHQLQERKFTDCRKLPVVELRGFELTEEYLVENGFRRPILVRCKDGLDLQVPPEHFSVHDVQDHVGMTRPVDFIDVENQEEGRMTMQEWTEYFTDADRPRVLNVISLELTGTSLGEMIVPPRIVNELSWVANHWPSDIPVEDVQFVRPEVQRYCLMGAAGSYTDFHVDFGGTSVWYHILRGQKVFYLIPPNSENLALYEEWMSSPSKQETFFGDLVDVCYKCVIKAGETVFLPSGWIHAVMTPADSMVFGGNFLHKLCIPMQLRVYRIEKHLLTPTKFMFPNFETLHWFAAQYILDTLRDYREDGEQVPAYLVRGSDRLFKALRDWANDQDLRKGLKRWNIPDTVSHRRLLNAFEKELCYIQNGSGNGKPKLTGKRRKSATPARKVRHVKAKLDATI